MTAVVVHPEAVKAAIRIKFGSIDAFARDRGFKPQAVRDCLRGQSDRPKKAIAELLGVDPDHLSISRDSTIVEDASKADSAPHHLIERVL